MEKNEFFFEIMKTATGKKPDGSIWTPVGKGEPNDG